MIIIVILYNHQNPERETMKMVSFLSVLFLSCTLLSSDKTKQEAAALAYAGPTKCPAPKDTPTAQTPPHSDFQPRKGSLTKKDMDKLRAALKK